MTANLGSDLLMQLLDEQPEASESDLHELLRPVLRGHFQPALLARFQTVIYRPLPAGALRTIVGMKLGQVSQRLACHYGINTTLSESLFDALTEACLLPDTAPVRRQSAQSADPAGAESAAIEPYGGGAETAPGDAGVSRRGRRRDGV